MASAAASTPYRPPAFPGSGSASRSTKTSSPYTTTTTSPHFTAAMRDRQARGKDPYRSESDYDDDDEDDDDDDEHAGMIPSTHGSSKMRMVAAATRLEKEDFARTERRHKAAAFLDNPELLMMYAQSKGDSIPGAKLHFTRMLCGYEKPERSSSSGSKSKAAAASAASSCGAGGGVADNMGGRRKSAGLHHSNSSSGGASGSSVGKAGGAGRRERARA